MNRYVGYISPPRWVWVDINGAGERWHLTVHRGDQLMFVHSGFEDYSENYDECPTISVDVPSAPPPAPAEMAKIGGEDGGNH